MVSWKRNAHKKNHLKLASQFVTCLLTLYFLFIGHQELVYENKNGKGFIDHKRGVEFSKKKGKNLRGQATLDSLWRQTYAKLRYRDDILIEHLSYTDTH